jgi:hypothetical protein
VRSIRGQLSRGACVGWWIRAGNERIGVSFVLRADKENLCLYGLPNGSWEVSPPADEVPPELPEPALGINFARDGMQRRDWLSLVAVHSDSWLISVAFFYGARLNANDRYQFCPVAHAGCYSLFQSVAWCSLRA